jgi:hypothetical protein
VLSAEDLYHTGLVVDDVEETMQRLTDLAGYRWMRPLSYPIPVWTPAGTSTVEMTMVYSLDEPRLELIRHVPGTSWVPVAGNRIHHIGYEVDDVAAASRQLAERGYPVECKVASGTGFHYHVVDGVRIEIVPRSSMKALADLLAAAEIRS